MIKNGLKPVQALDEKGFKAPGRRYLDARLRAALPAASGILRRETYGNYPGAIAILNALRGAAGSFDTA